MRVVHTTEQPHLAISQKLLFCHFFQFCIIILGKHAKKHILTSAAPKMLGKIYKNGDKEVSKRVRRGCVIAVAVERKKPDHAIETDQYLKLQILVNLEQTRVF